jgi:hypothetical protein
LRIAADRQIVDRHEPDDVERVHDKGGALGHAFLRVEDAECIREVALHLGQHGKRQIFQVAVMRAPGVVHELAAGAGAEDPGAAILKVAVQPA